MCSSPSWIQIPQDAYLVVVEMLDEILIQVVISIVEIITSIPFGAFLIAFGSIIYPPTGNKLGKYCLFLGLFLFTINQISHF